MSGIVMGTRYSHLTLEERCRLRGLMEMGLNDAALLRETGRTSEADKMEARAKAFRARYAYARARYAKDKALDRPAPLLLLAKSCHGRGSSKPNQAHTNYTS